MVAYGLGLGLVVKRLTQGKDTSNPHTRRDPLSYFVYVSVLPSLFFSFTPFPFDHLLFFGAPFPHFLTLTKSVSCSSFFTWLTLSLQLCVRQRRKDNRGKRGGVHKELERGGPKLKCCPAVWKISRGSEGGIQGEARVVRVIETELRERI